MTKGQNSSVIDSSKGSRRTLMKSIALTTGALTTGVSETARGQEDDAEENDSNNTWEGLIQTDNFHPFSQFALVSGVINWRPNYGDVRDSWFSNYDTYQIRWLNTDEIVPLYVTHDADIGEYDEDLGFIPADGQNYPQIYEMNEEWTPFSDNTRLITVNASRVSEEEQEGILETQEWWQNTEDS